MQRKGIGIRGLLPLGDMVRAGLTEKVVGAKTWTRQRVWAVRLSGRRRNAFLEHDLTGYLITSSCAYWPSLSALQTPWPPPSHLRALHTLFQSLSLLPSHPWLLDQLLILQVLYKCHLGNPLQYSCLENPVNRGAWRATVHRFAKSWAQLSD